MCQWSSYQSSNNGVLMSILFCQIDGDSGQNGLRNLGATAISPGKLTMQVSSLKQGLLQLSPQSYPYIP